MNRRAPGRDDRRARFRALRRAEDGAPSPLRTGVALTAGARGLLARFRSAFQELTPFGAAHDDDLWRGDVVELMVAPDPADRRTYYEIEVSPAGLVFDARVVSPDLVRESMRVDRSWNPAGLRVRSRVLGAGPSSPPLEAGRPPRRRDGPSGSATPAATSGSAFAAGGVWLVRIALGWEEIVPGGGRPASVALGAFRIDRRSTGAPIHLALFPTGETPANFHAPRSFGVLPTGG